MRFPNSICRCCVPHDLYTSILFCFIVQCLKLDVNSPELFFTVIRYPSLTIFIKKRPVTFFLNHENV